MRSVLLCLVVVVMSVTSPVFSQDEDYTLTISDASCIDEESVDVTLTLDFADGDNVQGYQWSICHDEDLLEIESDDDIERGEALDGLSYTFEAINLYDDTGATGWTVGALFNVISTDSISPEDDAEIYVVTYQCLELDDEETTDIEFCLLGLPVVPTELVVGGVLIEPVTVEAVITLQEGETFLRGDVDNNGSVSALLDALFLLRWAFQSGDDPACEDAADVNDSGTVQAILDSLTLLQWAFQDGEEPPLPGTESCGPDETDDDDLECLELSDECA